jgi:hypothetical protein
MKKISGTEKVPLMVKEGFLVSRLFLLRLLIVFS